MRLACEVAYDAVGGRQVQAMELNTNIHHALVASAFGRDSNALTDANKDACRMYVRALKLQRDATMAYIKCSPTPEFSEEEFSRLIKDTPVDVLRYLNPDYASAESPFHLQPPRLSLAYARPDVTSARSWRPPPARAPA